MTDTDYGRLRVLVVEDDAATRTVIKQQLLRLGVRAVAEACDGVSGLLELLRVRPDLVLCDVHMKPLGGIAFLTQLRAVTLSEIAGTAVVIMTSDASANTVLAIRALGADGYLVKPVALNQLRGRIDAVLAADPARGERIHSRTEP